MKKILRAIAFTGCLAWLPASAHLLNPNECTALVVKTIQLFGFKDDDEWTVESLKDEVTESWEKYCKADSSGCWHKDVEDLKRSLDIIDLVFTDEITELLIGAVYQNCMNAWRESLER